jgi:putative membrane protein
MENYARYQDQMILRDFLAADRTRLANERTLLAYARTFVGLLATGAGFSQLVTERWLVILGYLLMALSPLVALFGVYRFLKVRRKLKMAEAPQS